MSAASVRSHRSGVGTLMPPFAPPGRQGPPEFSAYAAVYCESGISERLRGAPFGVALRPPLDTPVRYEYRRVGADPAPSLLWCAREPPPTGPSSVSGNQLRNNPHMHPAMRASVRAASCPRQPPRSRPADRYKPYDSVHLSQTEPRRDVLY